ncbi:MAG: 50S ribosomal protein L17 [Acidobacteria bacterium]|nr:50S ribosomal protein L17 [Acidobacteriota bacterium]
MRHRVARRKLGRTTAHRMAMLRNLVTSLFEHERILTTVAKAKEARSIAEKMITLAKRDDLHSRRLALRFVRKKEVVAKLFDTIAPRFAERNGGYTRILRAEPRKGDRAEMAVLEILGSNWKEKLEEKKKKREEKEKKKKTST